MLEGCDKRYVLNGLTMTKNGDDVRSGELAHLTLVIMS